VGGVEKKVRCRHADIVAAVGLGIGRGRVESINNKIKVSVRMDYGFKNMDNLVSLLVLRCLDLAACDVLGGARGDRKGRSQQKTRL